MSEFFLHWSSLFLYKSGFFFVFDVSGICSWSGFNWQLIGSRLHEWIAFVKVYAWDMWLITYLLEILLTHFSSAHGCFHVFKLNAFVFQVLIDMFLLWLELSQEIFEIFSRNESIFKCTFWSKCTNLFLIRMTPTQNIQPKSGAQTT